MSRSSASPLQIFQSRVSPRSAVLFGLALTTAAALSGCLGGGNDTVAATTPAATTSPAATAPATIADPTPAYPAVQVPTLVSRAILAANSYVAGPTSGQYISGGDLTKAKAYGYQLPFASKQPIQGFSAIADGPVAGCYYAMQDNGFGGKAASPDALLHVYAVRFDWNAQTVTPADFTTCAALDGSGGFDSRSYIRLRDPDHRLGFPLVADAANYPGTTSDTGATVPVDPLIRQQRLLTGGDLDIESLVVDADGNLWFGEEFGPFLVKTDRTGKVLQREIPLTNGFALGGSSLVQTAANPYIGSGTANLPTSGGIESLAINPARTRLYTLLERELSTDAIKQRRMLSVFDLTTNAFQPTAYAYKVGAGSYVNDAGTTVTEIYTVNDMTAINDHEFLVMEKDRGAGDARTGLFLGTGASRVAARYKKIFRIDLNVLDADGFLVKTEVADLMNLADPTRIGGDATLQGVFTFPMESIETVHIVDAFTLIVANDNNYPGGAGSRDPNKVDNNEFIRIRLPVALNLPR